MNSNQQFNHMFNDILQHLLDVTDSEYGFIGEVLYKDDGAPYLKTHAITNIAWNDETRQFYDENAPKGLEFYNLNSLFGHILTSKEPVIANTPKTDKRSGGIPEGHPSLDAFLGVPLIIDGEMVGAMGIANRPGGYDQALVDKTQSLFNTIGRAILTERYQKELVSAQRRIVKEQEFTSAIMEYASAIIVVLDKQGAIVRINQYAETLTGYSQDELIGKKVWDILLDEKDIAPVQSVFNNLNNQIPASQFENAWIAKNGKQKMIAWSNSVIFDDQNEVEYVISIGTDISARKQVEKMKDEFVSTVSHELRTPLTSIRGSLGLLQGGAMGEMPESAIKLIDVANENTDRLLHLISDILDITKIESGEMSYNKENIHLDWLIETAVKENQHYAEQFGISYVVNKIDQSSRDAVVYADSNRLIQVLNNLLSNAAKFSYSGGEVEINLKQSNDTMRIEVIDHGIGIPEQFVDKIFNKFVQADSSDTRSRGGTGLGLSISQAIMQQHSGTISVTSKEGEGSTFALCLPIAEPDQLTYGKVG